VPSEAGYEDGQVSGGPKFGKGGSVVGPRSNFKNRSSASQVEASGAGSYDNHAHPFDDHVGLSDDGAGDTCARANRQHPERQLQHHGSGKGVQTESIQTESIQAESIQAGAAGTMARAEI
jgi:hypothetical protein